MKKICSIFLIAFISLYTLFAEQVAVFPPTMENVNDGSESWIPSLVVSKLEDRFRNYTSFTVINSSEIDSKRAEIAIKMSELSDDGESLEVGRRLSADVLCTQKVITSASGYSVVVRVTKTETNELLGSVSRNFTVIDFANDESWDKLAYELFVRSMKLELSESQKSLLAHEEKETSSELESLADSIKKEIADINRENAEIQERLIDGKENEYLAEKLKQNELKLKKIIEDEKSLRHQAAMLRADEVRAKKEAERRANLDDAEKKRIQKMKDELEKQKESQNQKKLRTLHPEKQITLLEQQKKVLNNQIMGTITAVENRLQEDQVLYEERIEKLDADFHDKKQFPSFFTDGKFNANGIKALDKTIKAESEKLEAQKTDDAARILAAAIEPEKKLIRIIEQGQKTLASGIYSEKTILDSPNLIVRVDEYNGEDNVWPMVMNLYFNGALVWNKKLLVSYKELTGKNPVEYDPDKPRSAKYLDFQNNINTYNSLFLQAEPVIQVEVNYSVKALDSEYPSVVKRYDGNKIVYPNNDSCYVVTVQDYSLSTLKKEKSKKFLSEKEGVSSIVNCEVDGKYHVWTSTDYWNLFTGTEEGLAEQKKAEKKYAAETSKIQKSLSIARKKEQQKEEALTKAKDEIARKEKIKEEREEDFKEFAAERKRQEEDRKAAKRAADREYRKNLHAATGLDISGSALTGNYGSGVIGNAALKLPLGDYAFWDIKAQYGKINSYGMMGLMADAGFNFYVTNTFSPFVYAGLGAGSYFTPNGLENEKSGFFTNNNFSKIGVNACCGAGLIWAPLSGIKVHAEYSLYYLTKNVGFVEGGSLGVTLGRF